MTYWREETSSSSSEDDEETNSFLPNKHKQQPGSRSPANANANATGSSPSPSPSWRRKWTLNLFWMALGVLVGLSLSHAFFYSKPSTTGTLTRKDTTNTTPTNSTTGSSQQNTVYGHLHIPKTAGTSINGALALQYERVCGHKGYSFDAIAYNQRLRQYQTEIGRNGTGLYSLRDSITQIDPKKYKGHNRGRVPHTIMYERGFQDCDWISFETGWKVWPDRVQNVVDHLELHIPCRDPIDHLLSMCNHMAIYFQCDLDDKPKPLLKGVLAKPKKGTDTKGNNDNATNTKAANDNHNHNHRSLLNNSSTSTTQKDFFDSYKTKGEPITTEQQIDACVIQMNRFHRNLTNIDNFDLKCFDATNVKHYMEYMGDRLQQRKITDTYVFRESNRPRHKDRECLTQASPKFKQRILDYLLTNYQYFQFCNSCMGKENHDLFVGKQ